MPYSLMSARKSDMDRRKKRNGLRLLRLRYGASNGEDREAEDALRRMGFNSKDRQQVIWDYYQSLWREAKREANKLAKKRRVRVKNAKNRRRRERRKENRRQARIDAVAQQKVDGATSEQKTRVIYFGRYKGSPMAKVPADYLAWCFGSFSGTRREIGAELRSRGFVNEDLERIKNLYPFRSKYPQKQAP